MYVPVQQDETWKAQDASRMEQRRKNVEAVKQRPDEDYFRSLDSSLKKTTGFVKKMKNIADDHQNSLLLELRNLNLTRYVSEIAQAIADSRFKISHVSYIVEVCSALFQRYADFGPQLQAALAKAVNESGQESESSRDPSDKPSSTHPGINPLPQISSWYKAYTKKELKSDSDGEGKGMSQKEREQIAALTLGLYQQVGCQSMTNATTRRRCLTILICELYIVGVIPTFQLVADVFRQLCTESTRPRTYDLFGNLGTILIVMKNYASTFCCHHVVPSEVIQAVPSLSLLRQKPSNTSPPPTDPSKSKQRQSTSPPPASFPFTWQPTPQQTTNGETPNGETPKEEAVTTPQIEVPQVPVPTNFIPLFGAKPRYLPTIDLVSPQQSQGILQSTQKLFQLFVKVYEEAKVIHTAYDRALHKLSDTKNDVPADFQNEYDVGVRQFGHIRNAVYNFGCLLGKIDDLIQLDTPKVIPKPEEKKEVVVEEKIPRFQGPKFIPYRSKDELRSTPYQNKDEQTLYSVLPDLVKKGVPLKLLFLNPEVLAQKEQELEKMGGITGQYNFPLKSDTFQSLLDKLYFCDTCTKIDKLAADFCHQNSLQNRKKIIENIVYPTRRREDLAILPYLVRLVTIMSEYFPDMKQELSSSLDTAYAQSKSSPPDGRFDSRIRLAVLLTETVKFGLRDPAAVFVILQECTDSFTPASIDLACCICQKSGYWLSHNLQTQTRMKDVISRLMKLKCAKNIGLMRERQIEQACLATLPERIVQTQPKPPKEPIELYMQDLLFQRLSPDTLQQVQVLLIKIIRTSDTYQDILINLLLKANSFKYHILPTVATLLHNLYKQLPELVVRFVDLLCDSVRIGIMRGLPSLIPQAGFVDMIPQKQQKVQSQIALLGECYNHRIVSTNTILTVFNQVLARGHTEGSEEMYYDPPDDMFRISIASQLLLSVHHRMEQLGYTGELRLCVMKVEAYVITRKNRPYPLHTMVTLNNLVNTISPATIKYHSLRLSSPKDDDGDELFFGAHPVKMSTSNKLQAPIKLKPATSLGMITQLFEDGLTTEEMELTPTMIDSLLSAINKADEKLKEEQMRQITKWKDSIVSIEDVDRLREKELEEKERKKVRQAKVKKAGKLTTSWTPMVAKEQTTTVTPMSPPRQSQDDYSSDEVEFGPDDMTMRPEPSEDEESSTEEEEEEETSEESDPEEEERMQREIDDTIEHELKTTNPQSLVKIGRGSLNVEMPRKLIGQQGSSNLPGFPTTNTPPPNTARFQLLLRSAGKPMVKPLYIRKDSESVVRHGEVMKKKQNEDQENKMYILRYHSQQEMKSTNEQQSTLEKLKEQGQRNQPSHPKKVVAPPVQPVLQDPRLAGVEPRSKKSRINTLDELIGYVGPASSQGQSRNQKGKKDRH